MRSDLRTDSILFVFFIRTDHYAIVIVRLAVSKRTAVEYSLPVQREDSVSCDYTTHSSDNEETSREVAEFYRGHCGKCGKGKSLAKDLNSTAFRDRFLQTVRGGPKTEHPESWPWRKSRRRNCESESPNDIFTQSASCVTRTPKVTNGRGEVPQNGDSVCWATFEPGRTVRECASSSNQIPLTGSAAL